MPAFAQVFRRICFGKSHATSTSTQFPCQLSLKMADKTTTCTRIMAFPALILSLCTLRNSNYRGITLLSIAGKVLAHLMLNRLIPTIAEENAPESQCGFWANRGTTDMVFVLRQIQEKCREQNMGLFVVFIDLTKAFDTVSREGLWKILARLDCPPKFLTILCQLHEGQMGRVKHNGALSDSFPNGFKQGCVLAPTLFSILFSLMLREAKEDLVDSIFIRFRTDGSIFNLRCLLAHTKTIEVLIVELLFADDCALLAHTQEALQYIVNRFAEAAKAFGFTISLKKTEVLHQPPPGGVYSPPQINIEDTSLNSVEHFTYLGSVISNDATVNKDLDNRLARVSSAFGRLHKRVWQNHSLRLSTKIQVYRALWSLPYCTAAQHGYCTTSRSGC